MIKKNVDFSGLLITELTNFIVNKYHNRARLSLSGLYNLLLKLSELNSEFAKLVKEFEKFKDEFENHLRKEEFVLFPYFSKLHKWSIEITSEVPVLSIASNPIRIIEHEHEILNKFLNDFISELNKKISKLDPSLALISILKREFKDFRTETIEHFLIENNYLFPKAMDLEFQINSKKNKVNSKLV